MKNINKVLQRAFGAEATEPESLMCRLFATLTKVKNNIAPLECVEQIWDGNDFSLPSRPEKEHFLRAMEIMKLPMDKQVEALNSAGDIAENNPKQLEALFLTIISPIIANAEKSDETSLVAPLREYSEKREARNAFEKHYPDILRSPALKHAPYTTGYILDYVLKCDTGYASTRGGERGLKTLLDENVEAVANCPYASKKFHRGLGNLLYLGSKKEAEKIAQEVIGHEKFLPQFPMITEALASQSNEYALALLKRPDALVNAPAAMTRVVESRWDTRPFFECENKVTKEHLDMILPHNEDAAHSIYNEQGGHFRSEILCELPNTLVAYPDILIGLMKRNQHNINRIEKTAQNAPELQGCLNEINAYADSKIAMLYEGNPPSAG